VQAMNGDMVNEVVDPSNISSYYACVDLELVAPGTLGNSPPAPSDTPEAPAPSDTPAADDGAQDDGAQDDGAQDDGAQDDDGSSEVASDSSEATLIPAAPPPSDTSAAAGAAAPTHPAGNGVAMNTTGMLGATGQTPSTPSTLPSGLSGSPSSSSGGGCNLDASGSDGRRGNLGLAAFGLLAVFGLRQRSRRARR
jgi:hypothetical protein